MLPAEQRVRRPEDFSATVRDGRRAGSPGLVLHLRTTPVNRSARVGFVVGRGVGTAVVRNRLRRQLRHLLALRLPDLPAGAELVVRVLPPAATLSRRDLSAALNALLLRLERTGATA